MFQWSFVAWSRRRACLFRQPFNEKRLRSRKKWKIENSDFNSNFNFNLSINFVLFRPPTIRASSEKLQLKLHLLLLALLELGPACFPYCPQFYRYSYISAIWRGAPHPPPHKRRAEGGDGAVAWRAGGHVCGSQWDEGWPGQIKKSFRSEKNLLTLGPDNQNQEPENKLQVSTR